MLFQEDYLSQCGFNISVGKKDRNMNSFDRIKKYFTSSEIEAIDRIVTELRSRWPDAKLKLFGSKVTGKFDKESD
ncbi:nucleotidyltransferase domain-containing protein, partial [Candidatus Aerophobetes bacterium]|nr:nucleotidyltransferase domain-containing protein [Candidatus Aerophobetes bacterium]